MTDENNRPILQKIQDRHKSLGKQMQSANIPDENLEDMDAFIDEIRQAGAEVNSGEERAMLRSLADYWANNVYQYSPTGQYPSTELEPYLQQQQQISPESIAMPGEEESAWGEPDSPAIESEDNLIEEMVLEASPQPWYRQQWAIGGGIVLVLLICAAIFYASTLFMRGGDGDTMIEPTEDQVVTVPTEDLSMEPTEYVPTEIAAVLPTATPTLFIPTATPNLVPVTNTPFPTPTAQVDESVSPGNPDTETANRLTPAPGSFSITLLSPARGQTISTRLALAGSFAALGEGDSIHVLMQPLGADGEYYVIPESYAIPAGATSGFWSEDVDLTKLYSFRSGTETVLFTPVLVQDDETRRLLTQQTRFTTPPRGVFVFKNESVSAEVQTGERIQETRLLYASYIAAQNSTEIITTRPDGSDPRQLTFHTTRLERFPALSPQGDQIVFVGRTLSPSGEPVDQLWLMDSNGENARVVLNAPGIQIERPLFSPDGRKILYSAVIPTGDPEIPTDLFESRTESVEWQAVIFDLDQNSATYTTNGFGSVRTPNWVPDSNGLIVASATLTDSRTSELIWIDPADSAYKYVFTSTLTASQPWYTTSGDALLYTAIDSSIGVPVIAIYQWDTNNETIARLTSSGNSTLYPVWYDGNIYFQLLLPTGDAYLFSMDENGENITQITFGPVDGPPFVGFMDASFTAP